MASLTGTKIKNTYDGLLKTTDNEPLDGTLRAITDGLGNNSALNLSTAGASVVGTLYADNLYNWSTNLVLNSTAGFSTIFKTNDTERMRIDAAGASVSGNLDITENLYIDGDLLAQGNVTFDSSVYVGGAATLSTSLEVVGNQFSENGDISLTNGDLNLTNGNLNIGGSIIHLGDTNTYFNFPSADNIELVTGGTQRFLVNNAGATITGGLGVSGDYSSTNGRISLTNGDIEVGGGISIANSLSLASFSPNANLLVIGDTGAAANQGMTIVSPTGSTGNIYFADGTTGTELYRGYVTYNHNEEKMYLGVNATNIVSIDSISANVTGNFNATGSITGGNINASSLVVSGNLTVDTNTLFVDAASNKVSIGTTSTVASLNVLANADYSNIYIARSTSSNTAQRVGVLGRNYGGSDTFGLIGAADVSGSNIDVLVGLDGTIGPNRLILRTASSYGGTTTERMRVDSSGDISFRDSSANEAFYWDASAASLGIGTTDIPAKLSLVSANKVLGSDGLVSLKADAAAQDSGAQITFGTNQARHAAIAGRQEGVSGTAGYLQLGTRGASGDITERMRIDSSGNVGIGTNSPDTKVHISATSGATLTLGMFGGIGTGTEYSSLQFQADSYGFIPAEIKAINTNGAVNLGVLTFETSGTERMRITSGGYLKASNSGTYLDASALVHEINQSTDNQNTIITRSTATSPYGISMRFTSTPNNTTNNFFEAIDGTATRCIIYSNGNLVNTNNSYGAISDAKLKENVVDASAKLEDLMQVQVRNFNYIGDDKKQLGVVAQELEQVFPSMIDESPDYEEVEVPQLDENGQEVLNENGEVVMTKEKVDLGTTTKSVKYSVFVPMLIKAIQELNAKVESLEAQLNA